MRRNSAGLPGWHPDGLHRDLIDQLLQEVEADLSESACPTSGLLNGSAAERRRRRLARRAVTTVVRTLPVRRVVAGPDGEAA